VVQHKVGHGAEDGAAHTAHAACAHHDERRLVLLRLLNDRLARLVPEDRLDFPRHLQRANSGLKLGSTLTF
jgi:hypothetical protein